MYVHSSTEENEDKAVHHDGHPQPLESLGAEHPLVCELGRMETTPGSRKLAVSSEEQYHVIVGRL